MRAGTRRTEAHPWGHAGPPGTQKVPECTLANAESTTQRPCVSVSVLIHPWHWLGDKNAIRLRLVHIIPSSIKPQAQEIHQTGWPCAGWERKTLMPTHAAIQSFRQPADYDGNDGQIPVPTNATKLKGIVSTLRQFTTHLFSSAFHWLDACK